MHVNVRNVYAIFITDYRLLTFHIIKKNDQRNNIKKKQNLNLKVRFQKFSWVKFR